MTVWGAPGTMGLSWNHSARQTGWLRIPPEVCDPLRGQKRISKQMAKKLTDLDWLIGSNLID